MSADTLGRAVSISISSEITSRSSSPGSVRIISETGAETRATPAAQDAKLFDWLVGLYEVWRELTADEFLKEVATHQLEVLHEDYVRTARSKGLSEGRVTWRHVLPNAMIPVVTVIGLQFAVNKLGDETLFTRQKVSSSDTELINATVTGTPLMRKRDISSRASATRPW